MKLIASKKILVLASLMLVVVSLYPAISASAQTLQDKTKELVEINKKITEQQKVLDATRKRKASLQNQLQILDQQIELSNLKLESISGQMDKTRLDMSRLNGDLVDAEVQIYDNKKVLREAIKQVYVQQRVGILEVMVGSSNLSEFMSQLEYVTTIQGRISNSISVLQKLNEGLKDKKGELEKAAVELEGLHASQQLESNNLTVQEQSKIGLLNDATLTEAEYQKRLAESIEEQQAVQAEISRLAANAPKDVINRTGYSLDWPIPARKVSAGFRDSDYVRIFKVPHNAIDVPTPQGTPVRAPADAIVQKVHDAGMGYSYIMLNHGGRQVTVYGHISSILVRQGQQVPRGTVIGLSGGAPRTPGAGWMTTGSHLHFEVWLNGSAVNPLDYLVG